MMKKMNTKSKLNKIAHRQSVNKLLKTRKGNIYNVRKRESSHQI